MKKFTSWRALKKQLKKDVMSPKMKVQFNTGGVRIPSSVKAIPVLDMLRQSHTRYFHWVKPKQEAEK